MTLFDWPTWLIVVTLLCLMSMANEIGFRAGRRWHHEETDLSRSVSSTLKGSVLGLVALVLAFSFSATTNRYDIRQRLVLDQANAVGTCYLRAGLLDDPFRTRIRGVLRQYVGLRLELFQRGLDHADFERMHAEIERRLTELWDTVEETARKSPEATRNSMIVPSANEVIDLSSTRSWASRNHLPDPVLVLLLASVVVSALLLGHSSGQAGRRHFGLWLASNLVFALVLFVVLDFDRPRRGLIRVDQTPLIELYSAIGGSRAP